MARRVSPRHDRRRRARSGPGTRHQVPGLYQAPKGEAVEIETPTGRPWPLAPSEEEERPSYPWAARLVSASDRRPCPRLPCSGPEKKRSIATLSYPISRFFVRVWTAADTFETPRPCYRAYILLLITCRKQNHFCVLCTPYQINKGVLRLAVGCYYLFTLTSLVMS